MTNSQLDQYFTPTASVTLELIKRVPDIKLANRILEPCNGLGAISDVLKANTQARVITNDIDPSLPADYHLDACKPELYQLADLKRSDWIISNPPFIVAKEIVEQATQYANVAMLLRISFLEPTFDRNSKWWKRYHPTCIIFTPRMSFSNNGKTDNVTTAWILWSKFVCIPEPIQFIRKQRKR